MSDLLPTEREQALEARLVELEMRVSFQEQALAELSDALADARMQGMRNADVLRVLDRLAEAERDRGVMIGQYAALRVEMMGVERERDEARGLLREAYPWLRNFRGTDNAGPMLARISTHLESK